MAQECSKWFHHSSFQRGRTFDRLFWQWFKPPSSSKKLENFKAAIALHFAYYNFNKRRGAIRMTPAMAASVEESYWTVAELVERCGE